MSLRTFLNGGGSPHAYRVQDVYLSLTDIDLQAEVGSVPSVTYDRTARAMRFVIPRGTLEDVDRARVDNAIAVGDSLPNFVANVENARQAAEQAATQAAANTATAASAANTAASHANSASVAAIAVTQDRNAVAAAVTTATQARDTANAASAAAQTAATTAAQNATDAANATVATAITTAQNAASTAQSAAGTANTRATAAQDAATNANGRATEAAASAAAAAAERASAALAAIESAAAVDAEGAVRRQLITPESPDRGYSTEFIARSATQFGRRTSLGGFRNSDGALEVAKVVIRNLAGTVLPSRWFTRIESDTGMPLIAWDYRGRFRAQPDEATIAYIGANIPGIGAAANYPLITTANVSFHKPVDHIIGIHAYGQSWEARNGQGAPAQNDVNGFTITGAKFPRNAITLNDGKGFLGWEGPATTSHTAASDFIAGQETVTQIQTPTGAMAFRLATEATQNGIPQAVFARSEARGETAIEALMPLIPAFPEAVDGGPWHAWEQSVINANAIAIARGTKHVVHFIPWTHGQSNIDDSYSVYMDKLTRLLNHMQARAMAITGQENPPHLLIVQQPSSTTKGYSDTFKVVTDFVRARQDATLVAAGYGHSMIDVVHWNRWGAVEIGELRGIAAQMRLRGLPWNSPMLANPRMSGNRAFVFDVIGAHDVIVDESIVSDRHYINGTYDATTGIYTGGIPVPFHGFEASQGTSLLTIESVTVERRRITVTLASPPASGTVQIRYAMHNNMANTSARGDSRSANRGTIRADWGVQSLLRPSRTLRRWLASDYFNFTI